MDEEEPQYPIFRRENTYNENQNDPHEKPSITSRGLAAPDPFNTRLETKRIQFERQLAPQELKELKFDKTDNEVYYRKLQAQGNVVGIEVKTGPYAVKAKTTAQYLSQGFRTISIQMRDMLADLNQLKKMLAKEEFEQTSFFS